MKSQYFSVYNNFDLVQINLQSRLEDLFNAESLTTPMSYQQILLFLDEQCSKFYQSQKQSQLMLSNNRQSLASSEDYAANISPDEFRKLYFRADRNISQQIFDNCFTPKLTPQAFIQKYIELLQTAKLCVVRQEAKQQVLSHRLIEAKKVLRNKTYVYLKLIQASVHSRYSDSPCFQYKITPSSIPIITVVNSLNPVLNHEYTLEMDQDQFNLIFYQSGIEIYNWKFSLSQLSSNTQFFNSTATEAVTFELQVKMLPMQVSEQTQDLQREISAVKKKLLLAKKAFQNLCFYLPFQEQPPSNSQLPTPNHRFFHNFTTSLFSFIPFLQRHVLVLHYWLIALIFVQCLAAVSWPVEFIDLIIAFGLIGVLYDRENDNISMYLWTGLFALFLSTLKTIWGALLMPFGMPKYPFILVLTIIFKIITFFFIWVCTVRSYEIADQRKRDIYGIETEAEQSQAEQQKPIFRANSNYYKNKKSAPRV